MTDKFLSTTGAFIKRQIRALRIARKGNVAMIFALAAIPLIVAGGSGIDLARSLAVRSKLYSAVDAAALAVASKVGITQAQAQVLAQQYFNANFKLDNSFGTPNPINVTVTGQKVTVTGNIAMPTTLMNVAGIHNVNLTASSEVVWGQTKIWVAMALDNTGSMCSPGGSPCANPLTSSKLYALKEGTKGILTLFQNVSQNPGDVRVSLVPFAKDVNAGATNFNATWIDWTDWDAANGACKVNSVPTSHSNKASCETASYCSIASKTTQNSCQNAYACTVAGVVSTTILTQTACNATPLASWQAGVWTANAGVWTPALHATWNGCIADRGLSTGPSTPAYDASNASPNTAPESKFPAEQWTDCPSQLQPLGYNWAGLTTQVNAMVGRGNTNQSVGLAWAWQSLSTGLPLSAPSLPVNTTRHIIILSDGENTQNRWSSNRAAIDARMQAVCDAAKADDIIVWAVFVDVGSAGSATSMSNCATGGANGGHYFLATTPAEIIAVFNVIGQQITNLRVAH